jgi:hypothetical protein
MVPEAFKNVHAYKFHLHVHMLLLASLRSEELTKVANVVVVYKYVDVTETCSRHGKYLMHVPTKFHLHA